MNSNLNQFTKPLKVNNKDEVYCPYIKTDNIFKNISGVPTPQTLTGAPVKQICIPNLSSRNPPLGYGQNICEKNTPHHISFYGESTKCYSDSICTKEMKTCYDPLVEQ